MKGSEVKPEIAMDVLLYSYCSIFHINPIEAKQTPISIIKTMMTVHGEVKRLESEEIQKQFKR